MQKLMVRGGLVRYEGARGVTWGLQYRDADGQRVRETLGAERDGWTRRRAEDVLHERKVAVRRERRRKLDDVTFGDFAREWLDTYPDAKGLKRSTRQTYRAIVERHLEPAFGTRTLASIELRDLDRYLAGKRREGLAPGSLNRHLNLLHLLFKSAMRRQLVRSNPVSDVERPREPRRRWAVFSPTEIGSVVRAFVELAAEADEEAEQAWREQARVVYMVVVGAGLRRSEVLGLRWGDVQLADPDGPFLRVSETWVRERVDTPKSEAAERTIALDSVLAAELFDHRARTAFRGDGERVFCHPHTGGALDHKRYAETLRLALARAGIDRYVRPFHDGRHTAITNDAASGNSPVAIMKRAGHTDFKTTQLYIDLAGVAFRPEAERLGRRVFGAIEEPSAPRNS